MTAKSYWLLYLDPLLAWKPTALQSWDWWMSYWSTRDIRMVQLCHQGEVSYDLKRHQSVLVTEVLDSIGGVVEEAMSLPARLSESAPCWLCVTILPANSRHSCCPLCTDTHSGLMFYNLATAETGMNNSHLSASLYTCKVKINLMDLPHYVKWYERI